MRCSMRVLVLVLAFYPLSSFADSLSVTPRDGHLFFTNAFDYATSTIDVVMFHLTVENDAQHLIAASKRGVKVRVLLDKSLLRGTAQNVANELTSAGIEVRPSSPAFTITHEKSAVIDNNVALISSINLTQVASVTRDFGVATADQDVITEWEQVFNSDWVNYQSTTPITPALSNPKLLWSPVNSEDRIVSIINSAQKSLAIEVENLGDWAVRDALKARAQAGVTVVVIAPGCVEGGSGPQQLRNVPLLQELAAAGVDARASLPPYTADNPYIHAKTIVADGVNFYVGSENFSHNSLAAAREVGIMENEPNISQQILLVINDDYANAKVATQLTGYQCPVK